MKIIVSRFKNKRIFTELKLIFDFKKKKNSVYHEILSLGNEIISNWKLLAIKAINVEKKF